MKPSKAHLKHPLETLEVSNKFVQLVPLSFLRKHKFKQYFQGTVNPFSTRSLEAESNPQLFLC